jgi:hypothetical protein
VAQERWQGAGAPAALWSAAGADFQPINAVLIKANSSFLKCATKMLDTKVLDETSLYNICKGRHMFW